MKLVALSGDWSAVVGIAAAVAADQTIRLVDPAAVPLATWAWVLGLSLIGWFANAAPGVASWIEGDGAEKLRNRLEILRRVAASLIAGFAAELLGMLAGAPNVMNFLAVIGAAYGGDKFIASRLGAIAEQREKGPGQ